MLHVIECEYAEVEHHGAIVEMQIVAARVGDLLDEPDHVIGAIADGARDERRQARYTHGAVAPGESSEALDGIFIRLRFGIAALERAGPAAGAENLGGIGAREGVAGNILATLDAFKQEGIFGVASAAQVGADGREQVGGERLVDGHEISPVGQASKTS